jgi:hypothetical protein
MIILLFQMKEHLNPKRREKRKHVATESGRVNRHSCKERTKLEHSYIRRRKHCIALLGQALNYNNGTNWEDILATESEKRAPKLVQNEKSWHLKLN